MSELVIEYVLEGHKRGYNFTAPPQRQREALYSTEVLRAIWRTAMPRGQGWGADGYIGARSVKAFTLPDDRVAVADVVVTDMHDENGRQGIRRAAVDVMTPPVFDLHLRSRLASYPAPVRAQAATWHDRVSKAMPRLKKTQSLILSYPYTDARGWWPVEALVLMLIQNPPRRLQRKDAPLAFTTLALDHRDGAHLIAMPADRAAAVSDMPVLDLLALM